MGRKFLMNWDEGKRRWHKMHKGTLYRVSCADLNPPLDTKEGSYREANAWWERKLADLAKPSPEQVIKDRYRFADLQEQIRKGQAAQAMMLSLLNDNPAPENILPVLDPQTVQALHYPSNDIDDLVRVDSVLSPSPAQTDLTIANQLKRFLAHEKARGKKQTTYQNLASFMMKLVRSFGQLAENRLAGTITGRTVTDLYAWLRNESKMAAKQQHKAFNHFRRFVRFLWGEGLLELPRNLDDRTWFFGGTVKVNPPSLLEVQTMLADLPERLRLYALLALNCGMYAVDMAMLKWEEYTGDRIIRKRTKTESHKDVPTVNYLLWPETASLLNKHRSKHAELVLTSSTGSPLWSHATARQVDLIGMQWRRQRKNKPRIALKRLRKTGSTLLEGHKDFARFAALYLGHSPSSVKDRHYSAYSQELFDEAISWLGKQILD